MSYLTRDPDGKWVHTTLWDLPAHTRVNVTILQYDSGSPLRNQYLGWSRAPIGGHDDAQRQGRSRWSTPMPATASPTRSPSPPSASTSRLYGVNSNAKNICGAAPCTPNSVHNIVKFSFITPGPGQYPWQCFVPCGLGYLYGNGGPMQTIGYMDGFLKVVG